VLEFLEKWIPAAEEMGATFFELTTALAFDWFVRQEVDVALIETGLGGRLDSTNVLTPRVATVTSIGLDHTDLLGDTLEAIAREKAGIFKPGCTGRHRGSCAGCSFSAREPCKGGPERIQS